MYNRIEPDHVDGTIIVSIYTPSGHQLLLLCALPPELPVDEATRLSHGLTLLTAAVEAEGGVPC